MKVVYKKSPVANRPYRGWLSNLAMRSVATGHPKAK